MNNQIAHVRAIIQYLEAGHDLNGQWPHPFLLRSFAIQANSMEEYRVLEHELRLNYYRNRLQDLLDEHDQQYNYTGNQPKRQRQI